MKTAKEYIIKHCIENDLNPRLIDMDVLIQLLEGFSSQQEKRVDVEIVNKIIDHSSRCRPNETGHGVVIALCRKILNLQEEKPKAIATSFTTIRPDSPLSNNQPTISSETNCPTCGSKVRVIGSDEGTHYYKPEEKPFKGFWSRLELFVKNVQVNDPASDEEKDMILNVCKKQNEK